MTNLWLKTITGAALCCILIAALPSKANAVKILSRPNYNSQQTETQNSESHGDNSASSQQYNNAPRANNSATSYSNSAKNSSANNMNYDTPYSKTNHLTVREITNFSNTIGTSLACMSDDEDKKAIRKYQNIVRAIMINKAKSKRELDNALKHFGKTIRKAHDEQVAEGSSTCKKAMEDINDNILLKATVTKGGDIIMPDGVKLIFDMNKVKRFYNKH
ncbi:MAG: hypothetical protein GY804_07485 [Alphaproteobacteria bacterium]|nr:hypothetical protein [Alphaproteobacteria bacterium]